MSKPISSPSRKLQVRIDKLVHGGAGMALHDGKVVFIPFSCPGDELDVEIVEDHESFSVGKIVRVMADSAERVEPRCPVFGKCGGCNWQHLAYDAQLRAKRDIVIDVLMRIGRFPRDILETITLPTIGSSNPWHYRNRIQLHVDRRGRVGFYKEKSHEVVEFEECFITDQRLNVQLTAMRPELSVRGKGISLKLHEHDYSFSQVNDAQNETLKRLVREWLQEIPHHRLLELYAGAGNFTFDAAAIADDVVAIEIDRRAIQAAQVRQRELGKANVTFLSAPAHVLPETLAEKAFDVVLLDPPRKGAWEALNMIIQRQPKAILYISCDPATLARDLQKLAGAGWQLERIQPVDMFPQTAHIETVSLAIRK
ncbi:MAG: class I SAM-dependent RNA methyltransferase [Deltaproteobacteria bacterium]|nr:class I SAM-dependent RNA methyltransferase [Deltaproteobacteria bacterium]